MDVESSLEFIIVILILILIENGISKDFRLGFAVISSRFKCVDAYEIRKIRMLGKCFSSAR